MSPQFLHRDVKQYGWRPALRTFWHRRKHALAYLFVVGVSVFAANEGRQATINACNGVNNVRVALVSVLNRQKQAIPHNPFFKQHPELIQQALRQILDDERDLGPVKC